MHYNKEDIITREELVEGFEEGLKFRKLKRKLISVAVIVVMTSLAIGIICFQGSRITKLNQRIEELTNQPSIAEPVTPEISLDIISTEIKEIGELATMEYLYTNAARFSDSKQIKGWDIPFTEKSFVIKWDGVIKAGVNVDEITISVDKMSKILTVTLPPVGILSHDTNENSVEILDESNGFFNAISVEDKIQFDAETVKEMEERAIENGLLEKARANVESVILKLLSSNPDIEKYYSIEFKDSVS